MKTVFKYLLPFKLKMTVGLSIKIVGTIVELFLPYILSHILKNVVVDQDVTKILLWGGAMVLCALVAISVCGIVGVYRVATYLYDFDCVYQLRLRAYAARETF